jgi:hypothetical protein
MKFCGRLLLVEFVIAIAFVTACGQGHADASVPVVTAETDDSIAFRISVPKKIYGESEDIRVNYVVQNKSRRIVYLVTGPAPRLRIKDIGVVELFDPVKGPDNHEQYDYTMIKIMPGRSYQGSRLIEVKELQANEKYNFETVTIQVGFSYLFDISSLPDCKQPQYVLPCLTEVYQKSKTLTVGNLVTKRKVE